MSEIYREWCSKQLNPVSSSSMGENTLLMIVSE
uniref:Uncharacterized protein n=1 Tax=Anguilla anguilla TaxID=7936 RepID=A0A0E9VJM0_ANGAN